VGGVAEEPSSVVWAVSAVKKAHKTNSS